MATNKPVLIAYPESSSRRLYADPSPRDEMQNKENDADNEQNVE
jgi:hypothetical protein